MGDQLETIPGVPIARVGEWKTSTGRWVCTPEQLNDAVRAATDPAFRRPVIKIGHTDKRFNASAGDGTPALGGLKNLRVDDSGEVLLADLVGVPARLARVLDSAYPSRSVEANLGVVTQDGNAYSMVVTGLALLGETPPAIESLGDVLNLFDPPTPDAQDADTWVAAASVAASITKDGTVLAPVPAVGERGPEPFTFRPGDRVAASVPIDDLQEQAVRYARANGIQNPWVREVWTDKVIVVGGDLDDPPDTYGDDLFEIDWTESAGVFTFTGPWEVRVQYQRINDQDGDPWDKPGPGVVTVPPEDELSASGERAAPAQPISPLRYVRGRGDVSTSIPEEPRHVSDIAAQVRERLGLPPDADDAAVTAALDQRLAAGQPAPTPPETPTPAPAPEPVTASGQRADLERLVAERVAAAVAPFRERLEVTSQELANRKEAERIQNRDTLLASAVAAGKIPPAERQKWLDLYDKGPESAAAVEQVFASLAKGTAVPVTVTAGAHTGGEEPSGTNFTDTEYERLFPDEAKAGAR